MRRVKKLPIFGISIASLIFIAGCSSVPEKPITSNYQPKFSVPTQSVVPSKPVVKKLYHQHQEWKGVRYQLGGLSKGGIDCSGFVYLTFKSKLGLHLPRTTRQQSQLGIEISKNQLQAGDLVFFRTGPTSRHVGIYLEKNTFLHVSQKIGVTISHLDNVYWRKKYWKSIRV